MRQSEEPPDFLGEDDDHEIYQPPPSETGRGEMLLDLDTGQLTRWGGLGVVTLFSWESACKRELHPSLVPSNPKVLLC